MRAALDVLCWPMDYVTGFKELMIFPLALGTLLLPLCAVILYYIFGGWVSFIVIVGVPLWMAIGGVIGMPLRWFLYRRHENWRYYN